MDFVDCRHLAESLVLFQNFSDHFRFEFWAVALSHSAFFYPLISALFYCPIFGVHHTGLFGKYLNGYPTIPPGWTEWNSAVKGNPYSEYNYTLNSDGKMVA